MRIVYKDVGQPPEMRDIPNTLEALQGLVGGYIEVACVSPVCFEGVLRYVVNEEGKLLRMKPNVYTATDTLVGPVIVTAVDGEDFRDLSEDEISFAKEILQGMEVRYGKT
jgi:hypothetical protein